MAQERTIAAFTNPSPCPAREHGGRCRYGAGMSAQGSNDYERLQQDMLRMRTSSTAERRAFFRQQRNTPRNTRTATMLVGAVYLLGGIGQTVKSVTEHQSALIIAVTVAATALAGIVIELGRRGRTRLSFAIFVVGMIALSLVGALGGTAAE